MGYVGARAGVAFGEPSEGVGEESKRLTRVRLSEVSIGFGLLEDETSMLDNWVGKSSIDPSMVWSTTGPVKDVLIVAQSTRAGKEHN